MEAAGRTSGVEVAIVHAKGNEQSLTEAFAAIAAMHFGGIVLSNNAIFTSRYSQIVALAAQYSISHGYSTREPVEKGGLMSYGTALGPPEHEAGLYVARILRRKPADLPVILPTKFDLAINLKTAKALGLTIPEAFLLEADEVIE